MDQATLDSLKTVLQLLESTGLGVADASQLSGWEAEGLQPVKLTKQSAGQRLLNAMNLLTEVIDNAVVTP